MVVKFTAFRAGLLTGLMMVLGLAGIIWWSSHGQPTAPYAFEGTVVGADVGRHGGRQVEVTDRGYAIVRQSCNGACDDLSYRRSAGDSVVAVRVLDANGSCIVCSEGIYVTGGMPSASSIRVGGADKLEARSGSVARQPDGSMRVQGEETVLGPAPGPKP